MAILFRNLFGNYEIINNVWQTSFPTTRGRRNQKYWQMEGNSRHMACEWAWAHFHMMKNVFRL